MFCVEHELKVLSVLKRFEEGNSVGNLTNLSELFGSGSEDGIFKRGRGRKLRKSMRNTSEQTHSHLMSDTQNKNLNELLSLIPILEIMRHLSQS